MSWTRGDSPASLARPEGAGPGPSAHDTLAQRASSDSRPLVELSVAQVYDMAADIGREFESLIDAYGPDSITGLMPKTILALEYLEAFASENDAQITAIESLQSTIKHLELEDTKKYEERQRSAREMEQIEEHYKQETRDLLATVKRLQDENRKLASSLAAATERDSAFSEDEAYFEVDLVNRLQSVIDKQRGQIKKLDQNALDVRTENEELKCYNDKLNGCTKDLRRKIRSTQTQLHEMIDERAEITAKYNEAQRDIQILSRHLGDAAKECKDLSQEADHAKGRLVYSENDPNRPRFNLAELKEILQERNSLKAKVSDLQDELAMFRPRPATEASVNSPRHGYKVRLSGGGGGGGLANCDCSYHSKNFSSVESDEAIEAREAQSEDDLKSLKFEDLPVQGPLPEDPDDAPWKRGNESGIRKLFSFITTRVSTVSLTLVASAEQELNARMKANACSIGGSPGTQPQALQ
ncbi:RILP-like protein homolog isoform X2 [Tigriopus californicus]|uniref:RILP-like protein homolog isoform X2 n=1 Tax=Tigriopus californicus TaxID=6832 RepID=UPI0027DA7972|nr:RILP-like protein homolog isoform X2 [Tigriopus californicus]